jgi:hypothetical protein
MLIKGNYRYRDVTDLFDVKNFQRPFQRKMKCRQKKSCPPREFSHQKGKNSLYSGSERRKAFLMQKGAEKFRGFAEACLGL